MRILNASYLLNVPSWTPKIKPAKLTPRGSQFHRTTRIWYNLSRNPYIAELRY